MLDLVFSDIPMAEAVVTEALHCTSDHETLRITVPIMKDLDQAPKPEGWILPEKKLPELAEMVRDKLHELPQLENHSEEIDKFTERLTEII